MEILTLTNLAMTTIMIGTPIVVLLLIYSRNTRQSHHSLLRNHPILGVFRYLIEKVGPEFRFYITDGDNEGKPLSRAHFTSIIMAAKYCKSIVGFGSKRDFVKPGLYLGNALFPRQQDEVHVDNHEPIDSIKFVVDAEGVFTRNEHREPVQLQRWLLPEDEAIVVGANRRQPFVTRSWFGCSAMSYGALGSRAHETINRGIAMTGAGWHNTGEGGVSPYHLTGADVIAQIGSGKFGFRTLDGAFDEDEFVAKANLPQVKAFELKLAQGAKIKGGHLEADKVTPEIAKIRGVAPWTRIDSPNRFDEFNDVPSLVAFVARLQELGGKPVGIKVVIGTDLSLEELAAYMAKTGQGPDFITVDGGEGGSGATYREMADTMGLPIDSGIIIADDTLRKYGVRDRVKLFASGKLHSADQICIALALGADCVNIARGFMIATGCIMTEKCHTGKCPVGVATTDPKYEDALVVDEKKYRVANYIATVRAGCYSLAAACGLDSPTRFNRSHVVFKDAAFRVTRADVLFPLPAENSTGSESSETFVSKPATPVETPVGG